MELKLLIAGIGGQGVIFATKVLSQAALSRGESVMASENHGMSQRGGSVQTHFTIGSGDAPLIARGAADVLVGLDRMEALRNLAYVRPGGCVYVNSANGLEPTIDQRLAALGIGVFDIDAIGLVQELRAPAVLNLVMLGFAAAHGGLLLTLDDLKNAVRALGPAKAVDMNLLALDAGAARVGAARGVHSVAGK